MSSKDYSDSIGPTSELGVEKPNQQSVSSLTSHYERLSESNSGIWSTQNIPDNQK